MAFVKHSISINKTNLFSKLFTDYLAESEQVKIFYNYHFHTKHFEEFLKQEPFTSIDRTTLTEVLIKQALYVKNTSDKTRAHINLLQQTNTYTVTTGHQLCLFTGPLYFIYKIISTINLCKTLQKQFPAKQFVPVYWMASEDHDFEEINHANVFGKKVTWTSSQKGSVGEFSTEGLQDVLNDLKTILGETESSTALIQLFEKAYIAHSNLADATRYLVNELFGDEGIIVLDGNDKGLKTLFKKEFEDDAFTNKGFKAVTETIQALEKQYTAQVKPREINSFYKDKGIRERIEKQGDYFVVLNTELKFTEQEFKTLIDTTPEKLSPNVVLRPLYQQKILPNVAYVGGPGEIAYWLEYKNLFHQFNITFPILVPRQFVMLIDKGTQTKMQKLNLPIDAIFEDGELLVKEFVKTQHEGIAIEAYKAQLNAAYSSIADAIAKIDKTLVNATEAEKQKALNGIAVLEQKVTKVLKQKSELEVNQIWALKEKLFPKAIPQERYDNVCMHTGTHYKTLIKELTDQLVYHLDSFEYTVLLKSE